MSQDGPGAQLATDPRRRRRLVVYGASGLAIAIVLGFAVVLVLRHGATTERPSVAHAPDAGMAGMGAAGGNDAGVAPRRIRITPERQQLVGVRVATVRRRDLDVSLRTVGILAYDQTRIADVHTRIAGWVERLYVNYAGMRVRKGQPLFSVYSPELVSTQVDYLIGVRQQREGRGSALADATRERLKLWSISDEQINRLGRTGKPERTLTLYSPFEGVVLERNTYAGQYINSDTRAFRIGDLATIWVIAEVFEYESKRVHIGQKATVLFPYGDQVTPLEGRLTFIYPDVDPQTRRVRLRLEFKNPGATFKPDSYVTVVIESELGARLAVPKQAIIDTGARQYALLALPDGYFEPRDVKVGVPTDELYPVLDGLQAGDCVVTSAQFLIDSETNLQAAMQSMSMSMPGMKMGESEGTPGMPGMPGMSEAHGPRRLASPCDGGAPERTGADGGSESEPMPGMEPHQH